MRSGVLAVVLAWATAATADEGVLFKSKTWDNGAFGEYPIEEYKTEILPGPRPNLYNTGRCEDDGQLVMISPRGYGVAHPGPMILDNDGSLVWTNDGFQQAYNLQVHKYKGEDYLTFWGGDDGVRGHGSGMYYMLNASYHEVFKIAAGNNLDGDLHEFRLTENGTALITVYHTIPADLRSVGGWQRGWIWEGIFQEIDIETREVLFEWRASEHIDFTESYEGLGGGATMQGNSWDWFHINSVDKDPKGNYLISSRWTSAVFYIDGRNGDIIWKLGGKKNMFKDLSNGRVTSFRSQHHARWRDNYTSITIFDNESPGPGNPSRGLWIDLDQEEMTAKLRVEFRSPNDLISDSQGSVQFLPNDNVLLGYGFNAQWTEFKPNGRPICTVHFGPASSFGKGAVQTYRVMKFPWVGKPTTSPKIASADGDLFMSWMGATEVTHYRIEHADHDNATDGQFYYSRLAPKNGFETKISVKGIKKPYVRALALDKKGNILGTTATVARGEPREDDPEPTNPTLVALAVVMGVLSLVSVIAIVYFFVMRHLRYRRYEQAMNADRDVEMENEKSLSQSGKGFFVTRWLKNRRRGQLMTVDEEVEMEDEKAMLPEKDGALDDHGVFRIDDEEETFINEDP